MISLPATNTHILVPQFELRLAPSVEQALAHLERNSEQSAILAGGTDLLVQMKLERKCPTELVYIGGIEAWRHIDANGQGIQLGSLVTFYDLQASKQIGKDYTALYEAARSVSGTQIKVMGTLGGNLCNASPAADSAPPLLVFEATVGLVNKTGTRDVRLEDWFVGPGQTVRRPKELLASIHLPKQPGQMGSAFLKLGRVGADIAKVSAAARIVRQEDKVIECRIALGAVAPTPLRARAAEAFLTGRRFDAAVADQAADLAAEEIRPITDVRSTAEYRRQVARVLVRDVLERAWARTST